LRHIYIKIEILFRVICIHNMSDIALTRIPIAFNQWVQHPPVCPSRCAAWGHRTQPVHAKHSQRFNPNDIWELSVEICGECPGAIGFATDLYDHTNHYGTYEHLVAQVFLDTGTTDGHGFHHQNHLKKHLRGFHNPYIMSIRINGDGMPQTMFNRDDVWHDFLPEGSSVDTSKSYVPCIQATNCVCLSEHYLILSRSKPTKSASKVKTNLN
jgi:hypothetical protein